MKDEGEEMSVRTPKVSGGRQIADKKWKEYSEKLVFVNFPLL